MSTQKLELTWIGKGHRLRLEPRVLVEDTTKSYGDPDTENMLIHGDNLLALKALEQDYSGKVKCIYIDPPYNTGNAFEHYDDWLEHSEWLNLMKPRLEILRRLLSIDGSIWITLDDWEIHYLKVLCDEIFGRKNFVWTTIWQHSVQSKGYPWRFSLHHNHTICYSKSDKFILGLLDRTDEHNKNYANPDNDPRGLWRSWDVRNSLVRKNLMYDIETPSKKIIKHPPNGWRFSKETFEKELSEWKIMFSADESRIIRKIYLADQEGRVPESLWLASEVWTTREANAENKALFPDNPFWTPKPERLIERILTLASKPGDLILDSFLGSGTTAAAAHKMGRKWIGIELWDHAYTHVKVRLDKVIDGADSGGITEATWWKGGGGYKFYELGPSVLARDERGRYVINPNMNGEILTRALCKIENFRYAPQDGDLIRHGFSTERDFIHITTRLVDQDTIDRITSKSLKESESLLIMAKSTAMDLNLPPNIQVKKIPHEILRKCEYAKDDYSLPILSETQEKLEDLKKILNNQ